MQPIQSNRLKNFAQLFKGYMGVMPMVTAATAPILTLVKAIPVYNSQKTSLATYSGLLGFLVVAWVFYARAGFVRAMVPGFRRSYQRTLVGDAINETGIDNTTTVDLDSDEWSVLHGLFCGARPLSRHGCS
jgi:hypothetical protein